MATEMYVMCTKVNLKTTKRTAEESKDLLTELFTKVNLKTANLAAEES